MERIFGAYTISDDRNLLDLEVIRGFMEQSYWGKTRPFERTLKATLNSHCFGVYDSDGKQVGFARVVTDYATCYYLCDVFIDENHRGEGIGKALVAAIVGMEELQELTGILATDDAFGLYERFGFARELDKMMRKPASWAAQPE